MNITLLAADDRGQIETRRFVLRPAPPRERGGAPNNPARPQIVTDGTFFTQRSANIDRLWRMPDIR